jgi:hypothetical protein
MRIWLSRSARWAWSCASCEFRCENWRDLTCAGVVAVERREDEGRWEGIADKRGHDSRLQTVDPTRFGQLRMNIAAL